MSDTPRTANQAAGHHRRRAEQAISDAGIYSETRILLLGTAIAEALLAIDARLEMLIEAIREGNRR